MRWMKIGIVGLAGGFASGLFGVGGGVIFVPFLILLLGFDSHLAVGTSLAAIVPTALAGTLRHAAAGSVDWKGALLLALFAVAGAWIGAGLSLRLDVQFLRKLFALFLGVVAFRLFFES